MSIQGKKGSREVSCIYRVCNAWLTEISNLSNRSSSNGITFACPVHRVTSTHMRKLVDIRVSQPFIQSDFPSTFHVFPTRFDILGFGVIPTKSETIVYFLNKWFIKYIRARVYIYIWVWLNCWEKWNWEFNIAKLLYEMVFYFIQTYSPVYSLCKFIAFCVCATWIAN